MRDLVDNPLAGDPPAGCFPHQHSGSAVLVLGVGNLLMGDEGVGVHALRALERQKPMDGVRLLDGGTGGINLLMEFDGVRDVILIDATRDGRPEGSITFLEPKCVGDLPRGLGAHDFGLKDLFAVSALLGEMPAIHLFTISVEQIRPMCMELSAAVDKAVPEVVLAVRELADKLTSE